MTCLSVDLFKCWLEELRKRSQAEEYAFIRGYVTAVAEAAHHHGQTADDDFSRRLLSAAGITRELAVRAGSDIDVERLDKVLGTRWLR